MGILASSTNYTTATATSTFTCLSRRQALTPCKSCECQVAIVCGTEHSTQHSLLPLSVSCLGWVNWQLPERIYFQAEHRTLINTMSNSFKCFLQKFNNYSKMPQKGVLPLCRNHMVHHWINCSYT
ncbi:hypothetical protein ACLKA6_004453 [Drosophila palustris]